jgi:biotin carboxyl carrier protein
MAAERPAGQAKPRVLIADERSETRAWLRRALGTDYEIEECATTMDAVVSLDRAPPQVMIIGGQIREAGATELLDSARYLEDSGRTGEIAILMVGRETAPGGQRKTLMNLEEDTGVFYVVRPGQPAAEIRQVVDAAVFRPTPQHMPDPEVSSAEQAAWLQRVLAAARRLGGARDLESATAILVREVIQLADADRAQCLFFDAESGTLWTEGEGETDASDRTAAVGLTGFAARTGAPVSAPRAASDPRYVRAIDDPGRTGGDRLLADDEEATHVSRGPNFTSGGDERILAQPIAGTDGEVHAVLVAVREGDRPEFEPQARAALATLAARCGPILHQLALELSAESVLAEAQQGGAELFREEALAASTARRTSGDVVRVSPTWVTWSYWLLVAVVVAGGVFMSVGTVKEYSTGPALIRSTGRINVTAPIAGIATSIEAAPGQRVEAGQPLAHLYDAAEAAELRRVEDQWEARLQSYLFDPTDEAARRALGDFRTERERARARVEERIVRAPRAGVVSDVRLRVGQHLSPGDIVMTISADDGELYVIALLPGADRPQLEPGMSLRLELSGYAYAYQRLDVGAVAGEVIGPAEARRFLGDEVAELPIPPSVVMVNARLPSHTFEVDGESYRYHDGMHGTAEVEIRSERIITALIPGLRSL